MRANRQKRFFVRPGLQALVGWFCHLLDRVNEKSQDIQSSQNIRQILLTISKVVFQVVVFSFQRVVIFVFDFSARSPNFGDWGDIDAGNRVIGDKAVLV